VLGSTIDELTRTAARLILAWDTLLTALSVVIKPPAKAGLANNMTRSIVEVEAIR
jgi:hypothetical protein